jgi:hypothetical protein
VSGQAWAGVQPVVVKGRRSSSWGLVAVGVFASALFAFIVTLVFSGPLPVSARLALMLLPLMYGGVALLVFTRAARRSAKAPKVEFTELGFRFSSPTRQPFALGWNDVNGVAVYRSPDRKAAVIFLFRCFGRMHEVQSALLPLYPHQTADGVWYRLPLGAGDALAGQLDGALRRFRPDLLRDASEAR